VYRPSTGSRLSLLSARPAVTFPAEERHHQSVGSKLYCLVTEAHGCEELARGCYLEADRPRFSHVNWVASERSTPLRCTSYKPLLSAEPYSRKEEEEGRSRTVAATGTEVATHENVESSVVGGATCRVSTSSFVRTLRRQTLASTSCVCVCVCVRASTTFSSRSHSLTLVKERYRYLTIDTDSDIVLSKSDSRDRGDENTSPQFAVDELLVLPSR